MMIVAPSAAEATSGLSMPPIPPDCIIVGKDFWPYASRPAWSGIASVKMTYPLGMTDSSLSRGRGLSITDVIDHEPDQVACRGGLACDVGYSTLGRPLIH